MEQKVLNAKYRTLRGKRAAAAIRKASRIPAVMYDRHSKSVLMDVDELEFMRLFKSVTESTIVKIKIENDESEVFIKDFQYNMVSDKIEHIDFYEVERGKLLRTKVQIKTKGSPEGIRQGGVLESGITELEVECLPKDLPPRIIVDVSNLGLNESIHVRDINVGENVTILTNKDLAVAVLKFASADVPSASTGEGESTAEAAK